VTQGKTLIGEGKFLSGSRDEAETGRDVGSRDPEGHLAGNLHFRTIRSMQSGGGYECIQEDEFLVIREQ
jgi:hypothetical protein